MLLSEAALLAIVFLSTQLLAPFGRIPFTMVGPNFSMRERFSSGTQVAGTVYALRHLNSTADIQPDHLDSLKEQPDLNLLVKQAVDTAASSSEANATSTDSNPIMQGRSNSLGRRYTPSISIASLASASRLFKRGMWMSVLVVSLLVSLFARLFDSVLSKLPRPFSVPRSEIRLWHKNSILQRIRILPKGHARNIFVPEPGSFANSLQTHLDALCDSAAQTVQENRALLDSLRQVIAHLRNTSESLERGCSDLHNLINSIPTALAQEDRSPSMNGSVQSDDHELKLHVHSQLQAVKEHTTIYENVVRSQLHSLNTWLRDLLRVAKHGVSVSMYEHLVNRVTEYAKVWSAELSKAKWAALQLEFWKAITDTDSRSILDTLEDYARKLEDVQTATARACVDFETAKRLYEDTKKGMLFAISNKETEDSTDEASTMRMDAARMTSDASNSDQAQ